MLRLPIYLLLETNPLLSAGAVFEFVAATMKMHITTIQPSEQYQIQF
jgi:hypothetical protein